MNVVREIVKPINHVITINLPEGFTSNEEVEVIILPILKENSRKEIRVEKFLNLAGKIEIDENAVNGLRENSLL
ncbi:MAG TPA: hypothetical protein P5123_10630 [Spirochaetota bacterium]|nr:hypothetical protein [Spirochaetota bacterium]